jgi:hypothetical protein
MYKDFTIIDSEICLNPKFLIEAYGFKKKGTL